MIKGLAITPPVIGRISIGKLVEKNGKWLPEKDDSFTLTTQVQGREGWHLHPLHQVYLNAAPNQGKLRALPIRLLFNSSDLNLRAEFSAFDRSNGRPVCVGDGETAKRVSSEGLQDLPCPTPEHCQFAKVMGCKLYGRLNVLVEGQQDELGSFIFRTTGYNSVRTLAARLRYFEAVSGGHTRYLPLMLRLRAKSTTQSHRAPVYYVDLTLREGETLMEAVCFARDLATREREAGVETEQLELAARQLLLNGRFEDSAEEIPQVLEEFYPEQEESTGAATAAAATAATSAPSSPGKAHTAVRAAALSNRLGKAANQNAAQS
ncbi:recombination directionality factor [Chitinimonas taiwanensis]|uniref:recombination directionality factor n=1 Tax=Chitinimonas taiwanensis TaxID=240412 RepID=UPI0035AEB10C